MLSDIAAAGLTVNLKKSRLKPAQRGTWLGFEIDTKNMMFFVTPDRENEINFRKIDNTLKSKTTTARKIAKIASLITSINIAIGPLTKLFTKQMHCFIDRKLSWDAPTYFPRGKN